MKILVKLFIQLLLFCLYAASFPVNAQDFSPQLTEYGHPDLRGVWNFSNKTPLERPERFGEWQDFASDLPKKRQVSGCSSRNPNSTQ
jgi:hypothetical protein